MEAFREIDPDIVVAVLNTWNRHVEFLAADFFLLFWCINSPQRAWLLCGSYYRLGVPGVPKIVMISAIYYM